MWVERVNLTFYESIEGIYLLPAHRAVTLEF